LTLLLGVALAAASALVSQVGFLLRHRGAVAAADVDLRRPWHSAVELFRQRWWTIGYALAVVAYLLHVGALTLAAMSVVQAVLAAGVVMLAVVAERFFGFHLGRRQWVGVVLSAAGLALLAGMGEARAGQGTADYSVGAIVAFESGLVVLGTVLILSCRMSRVSAQFGVLLGAAAGLLFTVTHVAVKAMSGSVDSGVLEVVVNPYLLLAVAGGVAAFFASARSLQIGPAVPVIAITAIAGNASSIPAGIVVFGDPLGDDAASVVLRSLAFVMVIVAAALIPAPTRAAEAVAEGEEADRARPSGRPATAIS
jgi:drug/metabolite transporter (DMT)-like permease